MLFAKIRAEIFPILTADQKQKVSSGSRSGCEPRATGPPKALDGLLEERLRSTSQERRCPRPAAPRRFAPAPAPPDGGRPRRPRAAAGDEDAFAAPRSRARPAAIAAARRVTGDPALAEDAAQEAFLRAYRALSRYRHEASFAAWVRTIAVNAAIDIVRRRRPERPFREPARRPSGEEKRHEDVDLLREALAALSPLDRRSLLARELEGDRRIATSRAASR